MGGDVEAGPERMAREEEEGKDDEEKGDEKDLEWSCSSGEG